MRNSSGNSVVADGECFKGWREKKTFRKPLIKLILVESEGFQIILEVCSFIILLKVVSFLVVCLPLIIPGALRSFIASEMLKTAMKIIFMQ